MSEKTTTTVTGLRMFAFAAPFKDYMGALVDIDGPWTEAMLERHDEEPERAGLWVWEGQCVVTVECAGTEDEDTSFRFDGKSRAPTNEEMQLLADDRTPLRGLPMPYLEDGANLLNVEPAAQSLITDAKIEAAIAAAEPAPRIAPREAGMTTAQLPLPGFPASDPKPRTRQRAGKTVAEFWADVKAEAAKPMETT